VEKSFEKSLDDMELFEIWAYYFENLTNKNKRDRINEILKNNEGIAMYTPAKKLRWFGRTAPLVRLK
jgi:hypothetical protein